MATFYGTMKADGRKANNKMGQRKLTSHTRGWDHGIEVTYSLDGKDKCTCEVWLTGGSNNPERIKLIKRLKVGEVSKRRPGREYYGHVFGGDEVRRA